MRSVVESRRGTTPPELDEVPSIRIIVMVERIQQIAMTCLGAQGSALDPKWILHQQIQDAIHCWAYEPWASIIVTRTVDITMSFSLLLDTACCVFQLRALGSKYALDNRSAGFDCSGLGGGKIPAAYKQEM